MAVDYPVPVKEQEWLLAQVGEHLRETRSHLLDAITAQAALIACLKVLGRSGLFLPEVTSPLLRSVEAMEKAFGEASQLNLAASLQLDKRTTEYYADLIRVTQILWSTKVEGLSLSARLDAFRRRKMNEETTRVVQGDLRAEQLGPLEFRFVTPLEIRAADGEHTIEPAWRVRVLEGGEDEVAPDNDDAREFLNAAHRPEAEKGGATDEGQ